MHLKRIITKSKWCDHLVHTLNDQESDTLMILMGGQNYSVQRPLLYYSGLLGIQEGYDVLEVQYGFLQVHAPTKFPEDFDQIYAEVDHVIKQALLQRHKKLILVGKSLGTVLIRKLKKNYMDMDIRVILLTPVSAAFDPSDLSKKLIIMGTGDSHYDSKLLDREEESIVIEFDGADHALESGDVLADLEIIQQVMGAIAGFIEQEE